MPSRRQRANKSIENILVEQQRQLEDRPTTPVAGPSEADAKIDLLEATINSPSHFQELLKGSFGPGQAPGVPQNLRVVVNQGFYDTGDVLKSRVALAWDEATIEGTVENPGAKTADQYEVWSRKADGGPQMLDTSSASTTATVESWEPSVARLVTVRARYGAGLWSQFAPEIQIIPEAPEPIIPKAPTGFQITENAGYFSSEQTPLTSVTYTWNAVTQSTKNTAVNVVGYQLWERNPGGQWIISTTTDAPTATIQYPAGSVREVRVRAYTNMGAYSAYSATINLTAQAPVATKPKAPTGVVSSDNVGSFLMTGRTISNVTISWGAVTQGVDNKPVPVREYEVVVLEPAGSGGATYEKPLGRTQALSLRVETPTNIERQYVVRAISTANVISDNSSAISITGALPVQLDTPTTPPIVTSELGTVKVSWDGQLVTGPVPPQYWHTRIQVSTDSGTTWKPVGVPLTTAGISTTIPATVGSTVFARLLWADTLGRVSQPSTAVSVVVVGVGAKDIAAEVNNAIEKAQNDALRADGVANTALSSANGKNTNYYQPAKPTGGTYKAGDTWFDTDDNYKMYAWSGSDWVLAQDSAEAKRVADLANALATTADSNATTAKNNVGLAVARNLDEYVVTNSSTTAPGAGAAWSPDTPDWQPGMYIWRRTKSTLINGTVSYSAPVVITGADGTPGDDAVLLRVTSSKGTSFKNSGINTVLTATVFSGALQITNITVLQQEFGTNAFLEWRQKKINDTSFTVISSSDPRLSQAGFALTVTAADVDRQTVFQCVLNT